MKVLISSLLFILLIQSAFLSRAQNGRCGTDERMAELLKTNPELLKSLTESFNEISQLNNNTQKMYKKGTTRTIPVVFHVIHTYGVENISKDQIEDQMKIINEDYQRLNKDTTVTRSIFKSILGDMDIEFKLARIDPNGKCTEGITRTVSNLTDGGDEDVKSLIRWDYTKYLNIWVIKTITGSGGLGKTLGYSYLPSSTNSTIDGIVICADYVGSIGTASGNGNKGRVLVHEAGHWLGLLHPFQGYEQGQSSGCGSTNCSNSGDYICDTPPVDAPSFGCPTTNNTCSNDSPNQLDMVENFMDYANGSCQNAFTKGQKSVVDYYLTSPRTRSKNITTATHTATGIFTNPSCSAVADFNTSNNIVTVCQGGTVSFKDYSYNGTVAAYEWSFDGGTPSTSPSVSPVITYATSGFYKVTLKVTNSQGTNTKIVDKMINVIPTISSNKTPVSEGFENSQILVNNWSVLEIGSYGWERTTSAKYEGSAAMVAKIDQGTTDNALFSLVSSPYNISVIKGRAPKLRFRVAYRPAVVGSTEILTVSVSTTCGQTWKVLKAYINSNGLGVDKIVDLGWVPTSQADWKELTLDLANYESSTNLMVKFEARSRSGNSIYLDNVNIEADLAASAKLLNANGSSINIYPNPSKDIVNIDFETYGKSFGGIKIINSTGQIIENIETLIQKNNTTITCTLKHIPSGIYFAQINLGGQTIVKKFTVIH